MAEEIPTFRVRADQPFWQLWARSITGVNLAEHCMKSLEGVNARGLGPRMPRGEWRYGRFPEVPRPLAYYICGVSFKNDLSRNAHMLLLPNPDRFAQLEWDWGAAEVSGAEQVPIVPDDIDPTHAKAGLRVYSTCRNWQAAWMLARKYNLAGVTSRLF